MQTITTIGLDIAKSVFQVHGVDAEGKVIRLSGSFNFFAIRATKRLKSARPRPAAQFSSSAILWQLDDGWSHRC
jgi:transposase